MVEVVLSKDKRNKVAMIDKEGVADTLSKFVKEVVESKIATLSTDSIDRVGKVMKNSCKIVGKEKARKVKVKDVPFAMNILGISGISTKVVKLVFWDA